MVDAACAECAGISKLPSVLEGFAGSSFGGASWGATYAQMISLKHEIYGVYSHFGDGWVHHNRIEVLSSKLLRSSREFQ